MIALTRAVSDSLSDCELTHLDREPIDVGLAVTQHQAYENALRSLGAEIVRAPAAPHLPDAVFVEDVAVVLDEMAIITRPGAPTRRKETEPVAQILARFRPIVTLEAPATLDGGDVLQIGRILYVGRSSRTNDAGRDQLRRHVEPLGYRCTSVDFAGCLHLKSAVTVAGEGVILVNPGWVSPSIFDNMDTILVDPVEPMGANALRLGTEVIYPAECPRTADRMRRAGIRLVPVEMTEAAKAEGGVTCCSVVFPET